MNVVNQKAWLPSYFHTPEHIYILLTSLNLGGAEKIVSDQLWANYYSKAPKAVTLIVIYEKRKEHALPPNVNVVRLNNKIENGKLLFQQIAYENKPLVCHLINDVVTHYLFSLNLHLHLVIHNDKRGWPNTIETLNHPQIISLVAVAQFVEEQLKEVAPEKKIYRFRHNIKEHNFAFKEKQRIEKRKKLNLTDSDLVIGMTGRIAQQKNYFFALDVLYQLVAENKNYKLVILGGFEPQLYSLYIELIQKINKLKLHKHAFLIGFKTDPQDWLNAFDIGLNTSYFEGLSMATQEVMRNGLPMVVSKVCGQPEIIDNHKQLLFFDMPEVINTPETNRLDITMEDYVNIDMLNTYKDTVNKVSQLIKDNIHKERLVFTPEDSKYFSFICYASHNKWNLLNHVYPDNLNAGEVAFITSNLNAGGAQRSLVNLLREFSQDITPKLVLLNQSNQTQYFNEIIENKIDYYLCHKSTDVFDISTNLFNYFHINNIKKIVFWNVDSKMKLLISKFFAHRIDIIDVSPGDYILTEMERETVFQDAIYYHDSEYFKSLDKFVSKYDNRASKQDYKLWLKEDTVIIPNGVLIEDSYKTSYKNQENFKVLVCGRITPSKHLDTIFPAFIEFSKQYGGILEVVGSVEPDYMEYYDMLIKEYKDNIGINIILKGHHDNPMEIMKNYHLIIVLGTHQGSPNVVLEAAACHLPVIANDSGGTREIIEENTGILLEQTPNVNSLYQALEYSYLNYDNAWQKAENCYNKIRNYFSMSIMKEKYEKIINEKPHE